MSYGGSYGPKTFPIVANASYQHEITGTNFSTIATATDSDSVVAVVGGTTHMLSGVTSATVRRTINYTIQRPVFNFNISAAAGTLPSGFSPAYIAGLQYTIGVSRPSDNSADAFVYANEWTDPSASTSDFNDIIKNTPEDNQYTNCDGNPVGLQTWKFTDGGPTYQSFVNALMNGDSSWGIGMKHFKDYNQAATTTNNICYFRSHAYATDTSLRPTITLHYTEPQVLFMGANF